MISLIICSVNEKLLNELQNNIRQTIGVAHEIIVIDNKKGSHSIAAAYNTGAQQSKFPYLCFIHEDIKFHTPDWGKNLINHFADGTVALAGILGCTLKTKAPSGVFIPIQQLNRVNQIQRTRAGAHDEYYFNPDAEQRSEVCTVDGMFLATTRQSHQRYPFDGNLLTGFHGYDIDFSLGQSLYGKVVVIYDVLIEHFSYGGNTPAWIDAQLKVTKKWRSRLPLYVPADKPYLPEAEMINTGIFLSALIDNHYLRWMQLKYILKGIVMRPFSTKNIRIIGKFLKGTF